MIEFCTKRRMVISVVGLGILTLLVLILEEVLTSGPVNQAPTPSYGSVKEEKATVKLSSASPSKLNLEFSACWLSEKFEILEDCAPCTGFEINSQSPIVCTETGLKEKIKCETKGISFRSCKRVKAIEKRNFILFSFSMLLLFVLSYGVVKFRTSQLERKTIKNIERRLAAGH